VFGRRPREFSTKPRHRPLVKPRLEPRISQALSPSFRLSGQKGTGSKFASSGSMKNAAVCLHLSESVVSGKTALVSRFLQEFAFDGVSHESGFPNGLNFQSPSALLYGAFMISLTWINLSATCSAYLFPDEDVKGEHSRQGLRPCAGSRKHLQYARILIVLGRALKVVQEGRTPNTSSVYSGTVSLRTPAAARLCQGIRGRQNIITTRFPIPDPLDIQGHGYTQWDTDELDIAAACQLLLSVGAWHPRRTSRT